MNLLLIYITGGSLGARSINHTVSKIIPQLIKKFRILHQCGMANRSEDFKQLSVLKNTLSANERENYKVVEQIDPHLVGSILHNALLCIGRAGANTVAELARVGVPSILIPLPWSAEGEQTENARLLRKLGLAIIISQQELTSQKLLESIILIASHRADYQANKEMVNQLFPQDANKHLVAIIESVLPSQ